MNAIVIGADRLGNIPELLSDWNINITRHITGRHVAHQRKPHGLPRNTELLILFTDFLGHNVMRHFRNLALVQGIPFIACRRSTSCLAQSLECCFNKKLKNQNVRIVHFALDFFVFVPSLNAINVFSAMP
jgi:hypothetical protein